MNATSHTGIDLTAIQKAQAATNGYSDAHMVIVVDDLTAALTAHKAKSRGMDFLTDGSSLWTEEGLIGIDGGTFLIVVAAPSTMVATVYITKEADPATVIAAIQDQDAVRLAMGEMEASEYLATTFMGGSNAGHKVIEPLPSDDGYSVLSHTWIAGSTGSSGMTPLEISLLVGIDGQVDDS